MSAQLKFRIALERAIVKQTAWDILAKGYIIRIDNADDVFEDQPVIRDYEEVDKAIMQTDEDTFYVYEKAKNPKLRGDITGYMCIGFVKFIYGNNGDDVMHDWSVNLEERGVLANAHRMSEAAEQGKFQLAFALPDRVYKEQWDISGVHTGWRIMAQYGNVHVPVKGFAFDKYKSGSKAMAERDCSLFFEAIGCAMQWIHIDKALPDDSVSPMRDEESKAALDHCGRP